MPKSMTGFARAEVKENWGTVTCELKSVNHRFLDIYFRLPENLRELEISFRNQIKEALSRGKVECSFQVQIGSEQSTGVTYDLHTAKEIIAACDEISQTMSNAAPLNPMDVMQFPGVVKSDSVDPDHVKTAAVAAINQALVALNTIRAREGADMSVIVNRRIDGMYEQLGIVKEAFPQIKEALETRLRDRLSELNAEVNPDRVEQELVILAQKMDVDEEMDRLQTHLDEVRRVLASEEPIGRRLDFLMQELNREANTLASKSQAVQSTNVSVEMKVLIEQMREQIQNIE